jgi:hypothetical protein
LVFEFGVVVVVLLPEVELGAVEPVFELLGVVVVVVVEFEIIETSI